MQQTEIDALYEQFCADYNAAIPAIEPQDFMMQQENRQRAGKVALAKAIERERIRAIDLANEYVDKIEKANAIAPERIFTGCEVRVLRETAERIKEGAVPR